jgi:GT2 family glycosyltransferase
VRKVEKIPKAAYGDKYYSLDIDSQYKIWLENNKFTDGLLKKLEESSKKFHYKPKISIVMPVYNTDSRWLNMAIESVINQTYSNWELCISDDASTKKSVKNVLNKYRKKDPRINTVYLHKNSGIASASNAAISLTTGEFIGFLDHDDELMPDTLFEVVKLLNKKPQTDFIYTDEDKKDQKGRRVEPFFKPDWSPDLLLSMNYPGHFTVFRKSLIKDVGGFRLGFEGSQDYDLILRFTEKTNKIAHISKPLYSWRKIPGSAATKIDAKPFARKSAIKALQDTLERRGIEGEVVDGYSKGYYRVKYKIKDEPLVSIIILTKDKYKVFKKCIESIESVTAYKNYEIIILDHNSRNPDAVKYLNSLKSKYRIVKYHGEFNFAKMNNLCVSKAKGMHIVFLNNDIEIIEPQWLEAMLEHSQRPEVGIVGTLLLYPEKKFMGEKIQHGGVVLGVGGFANHAFRNISKKSPGYFMLPKVVRNCSAVTAACAMIRRNVFEEMGGFDECLAVAFNDVDLCLSLKDKGYRIVYTPFSVLLHHEHKTRDAKHPPEDETYALKRWGEVISKGDPYYNLNLSSILCFRIAPKSFMDRPISALFEIYYSRPDLQNMYPEIKLGNYENLIDWAVVNGVTIDGARHLIRPYYSWCVENASQKVKPLGTLFDLYNLDTKLQKLFPEVLNGKYDRIIKWASQLNQKDCKKNPELKKLLPYLPWYENNKSKIPLII